MKIQTIIIRSILPAAIVAIGGIFGSCKKQSSSLEVNFPDKFEGKRVEMVSFTDSVVLQSDTVRDGRVVFDNADILTEEPVLVELMIDGRVKAFAVVEPGKAVIADSISVAQGTPLNDRFFGLLHQLDSVENLDDMGLYLDFAEKKFNENKENVLGNYFGLELIKFGEPLKVDSFLKVAPRKLVESKKAARFIRFAELRRATAPGNRYVDFSAPAPGGKGKVKFSSFIKPGNYTIVDFWASWCPYCIKEIPALKELYAEYKDKGVDIVGVAVRDKVSDTRNSVEKHQIPWQVMYDAQRVPYDIYGFTGIPHLMLIGPDGTIISRGESPEQIRNRLSALTAQK